MSIQSPTASALPLADLDVVLADHPFGNSDYITGQMHVCFKRRLRKLSAALPSAKQLVDAIERADGHAQYRMLGDMVLRCAVQHAMRETETGIPYGLGLGRCDEIFTVAARKLQAGECAPLGSGLVDRLGPDAEHGWIWSAERTDDVLSDAFYHVVEDNYDERPCTISPDEIATLQKGRELLDELLPLSSRSALSHAHLVAVFPPKGAWATRSSSSEYRLSGTVFLSHRLVTNVWWAAEHLFHEALHQQLYDFRQGHSLLADDFDREDAPTVCALWNVPDATRGNFWDVHRSLAAYHVYVHLALLSTLAEQRAAELEPRYGPQSAPQTMVPSRTALARAHYLREQLRGPLSQEVGSAGTQLVNWFSTVLDVLDPAPPPQGACVHLLFDRYWREAREIAFFVGDDDAPADLGDSLAPLVEEEVRTARRVLGSMSSNGTLSGFDDALGDLLDEDARAASGEGPGMRFARVRALIMNTIMSLSSDGYTLSESLGPDAMVREMIERSSVTVAALVGR